MLPSQELFWHEKKWWIQLYTPWKMNILNPPVLEADRSDMFRWFPFSNRWCSACLAINFPGCTADIPCYFVQWCVSLPPGRWGNLSILIQPLHRTLVTDQKVGVAAKRIWSFWGDTTKAKSMVEGAQHVFLLSVKSVEFFLGGCGFLLVEFDNSFLVFLEGRLGKFVEFNYLTHFVWKVGTYYGHVFSKKHIGNEQSRFQWHKWWRNPCDSNIFFKNDSKPRFFLKQPNYLRSTTSIALDLRFAVAHWFCRTSLPAPRITSRRSWLRCRLPLCRSFKC